MARENWGLREPSVSQVKPILIKMIKGDEEMYAKVFDNVAAILSINPGLLP